MIAKLLQRAGYRTLSVPSGDAAYETLLREQVNLLVSDAEMPGMDGFELIRRVRSHERLSALPAILMTSLDDDNDRQRGAELGVTGYIGKQSFDRSAFLAMVGQCLRQEVGR
jgi:CheY-like chemotaxis protein